MKEQLSLYAKKYNFLDTIDINKYVDAIDQKSWKVAKIVAFKNVGHRNVITLHFDGHTDKWDEDFDLPATTKMAPFRRYTLPYTGPGEGFTINRPPPQVSKFSEVVEQLKKLVSVQKEKLHGDKIVQKYRGEAFILIDNILTQQVTYRLEEMQQIQKLLELYIEVGIHIIKYSLEKIGQINKQSIQDPNLIYVNPIHAIVSSLPEVLFNFNSLISKKEKRVKFFLCNDRQNGELRSKYRNILKSAEIVPLCKRILQYQSPPSRGFNWSIKKEALILLNNLNQSIQFPKIIDSRQINEAIDFLGYIKSKQTFTEQEIQVINVDLVVSLILSGNFEGKLKGLTQLKRLVQSRFGLKKQTIKERVLNSTLLFALTDSATFNGEIFKRSLPIFETAAKYQVLSDQIIKRILSLHKDKHQLEVKSYFASLAQFGEFLNEKKVVPFFEALKQFPLTLDTINLIRDFTLKVIKQHPVFKKKYIEPNGPSFGVDYLWQVIKQSNSPQIVNNSILAFSALVIDSYYKPTLEKYFSEFFSNIKARKNVQNSLKIIYNSLSKSRQIASTIENLDKQFGIIDTVIKSLMEGNSMQSSTIKSIFQFLEQVNHTVKKKITVEHIKDLWNLKQCQGPLLQFMRKSLKCEKPHEKIINKRLGEKDIKEIISKIFLNKALMDNYSKCDEEMYKTFDELLVSVNNKTKAIQYNYKHSIKCFSVNELFGLQLYLEIALNSKNQDLQKKALKRFIQFYLRPSSGYNKKIAFWVACVDKFSKYLEQSHVKYIAFLTMLEQIQGRMKSINILDESQSKFTVLLKGSNSKKTYSLPYCLSLWKLRQIIDQDFDLKKSNFEIYFSSKRTFFDMDREEDFSVMFIDPPKDASEPCVIISESRDKHPQFVAIEQFKAFFAQNYGEKIYESLNTIKKLDIQQIALKVLKQLPNIKGIESKISKLDVSNQSSWDQIFDPQCRVRLSYQIKIFNKLKSESGVNWTKQFLKKGGAEHLEKILKQRCPNKNPTVKDYQYFSEVLGIYYQVILFYRLVQPNFILSDQSLSQILRLSSKEKSNFKSLYNEPTFLEYFYSVIGLIRELLTNYPINMRKILSSSSFSDVLQILLFTEVKIEQQNKFPENIKMIYEKSQMQNELSNLCEIFLKNFSTPDIYQNSRLFFELLVYIFDQNFVTEGLFQTVTDFIKKIRFQNAKIFEENQNSSNQLVVGWLKITKCLYLKSITANLKLKVLPEPEDKFALFLINDGLFGQQHRFQSERTRFEALEILSHLNCKAEVMQKVSGLINPIIKRSTWRKQNEWFVRNFKKREKNAQVGLRNLAATCYINSLLQQLFSIKQFSLPFLTIEANKIQVKQNVAYQIQKIFAYLTHSNRQVFSTETLCEKFIVDGQPIDPRVQMDIDQFFHTLMDKLQFNLKKISKQNLIDDIFQGEYSNLIVGQQCQHKSERIQHFLSMRLEIINKSSLTQALTQFIKAEVLEGQNAYFCQKCDKKIKALKRVCVKSLPEVLILTLKRFQFDFEKMEKFKLNSYCSFQEYLDMQPYMRQSLYDNQDKLPSEQYKYRLKGVVVHYGISEAGHYTSYIRREDNKWYYFDDDKITSFSFENLGKECFGGPDDNPYSEGGEKLKNAYLLIYEKTQKQRTPKLEINPEIKAEVDAQNLNNKQIKMVFDHGLQNFFDNNYLALGKNYIFYVHLVILRSDQRSKLFKKSYENCRQIFEQTPGIAKWYLEQFNDNIIKQFLVYGLFQASQFVCSLITFALTKAFSQEFIVKCLKFIDRKNMTYLNKIFYHASQIPQYFAVLNSMSFQDKIIRVIKQDKAPNQTVSKIQGNTPSEFGQPNLSFYQKKDFRSIIQLFQSVQGYTIKSFSIEDLQFFVKKIKKHSIMVSLAEICVRRFKDEQSFISIIQKFVLKYSINSEPKFEEEHIFKFALMALNKFCFLKDELAKKRISIAAEAYFLILKESFTGYKVMKYTLEALFSLAFNNQYFRDEIINQLNQKDNKKYIKNFKDWMKDSDKVLNNLKFDKLGYWRKLAKNPYSVLQRCENDVKVPPQKYLSLFNALTQKHKIDFPDLLFGKICKGEKVYLNQHFQYEYVVIDKLDILLIIRNSDNQQRVILEDDVFLNRSV